MAKEKKEKQRWCQNCKHYTKPQCHLMVGHPEYVSRKRTCPEHAWKK